MEETNMVFHKHNSPLSEQLVMNGEASQGLILV